MEAVGAGVLPEHLVDAAHGFSGKDGPVVAVDAGVDLNTVFFDCCRGAASGIGDGAVGTVAAAADQACGTGGFDGGFGIGDGAVAIEVDTEL